MKNGHPGRLLRLEYNGRGGNQRRSTLQGVRAVVGVIQMDLLRGLLGLAV
jgi:hypothetical protein